MKGFLPAGFNPKDAGVSALNDVDGTRFLNASVIDLELGACEFASIVAKGEEVAIKNSGPYLPTFVPEVMEKVCLTPFNDFPNLHCRWFRLPGRGLGCPDV